MSTNGTAQPSQAPPADEPVTLPERTITVSRYYFFAAGQRHFYEPEIVIANDGPLAEVEEDGARTTYNAGYLRSFVEGRAHYLPPDVQRVIVYEWLKAQR